MIRRSKAIRAATAGLVAMAALTGCGGTAEAAAYTGRITGIADGTVTLALVVEGEVPDFEDMGFPGRGGPSGEPEGGQVEMVSRSGSDVVATAMSSTNTVLLAEAPGDGTPPDGMKAFAGDTPGDLPDGADGAGGPGGSGGPGGTDDAGGPGEGGSAPDGKRPAGNEGGPGGDGEQPSGTPGAGAPDSASADGGSRSGNGDDLAGSGRSMPEDGEFPTDRELPEDMEGFETPDFTMFNGLDFYAETGEVVTFTVIDSTAITGTEGESLSLADLGEGMVITVTVTGDEADEIEVLQDNSDFGHGGPGGEALAGRPENEAEE